MKRLYAVAVLAGIVVGMNEQRAVAHYPPPAVPQRLGCIGAGVAQAMQPRPNLMPIQPLPSLTPVIRPVPQAPRVVVPAPATPIRCAQPCVPVNRGSR